MIVNETLFEYSTTLNGGIVQVYIDLSMPSYMDRLDSVYFECVNVTSLFDKNTLTALSMEAEEAYSGDNFDAFNPETDAHRLGD